MFHSSSLDSSDEMTCRFQEKVTTSRRSTEEEDSSSIHYVPFKVEYEGPANVKDKFTNLAQPLNATNCSGDLQDGKKVQIPEDFEGVILTDESINPKPSTPDNWKWEWYDKKDRERVSSPCKKNEESPKVISVSKRFHSMTYWNWDKEPSPMDNPVKLNDWLQLSSVIHEPVGK